MGTSSTLAMIAQGLTPLKNDQFAPIARVTTDQLLLLVPAASPAKDIDSFGVMVKKIQERYRLVHLVAIT
jgi:tripartite-type tricarboxylate transporter receptor subunit TctC